MKAAVAAGLCAAAFAVASVVGANRFVANYNEQVRRDQVVAEQRASDVQLCRLQLGIDKPEFHFRRLMMACAAEAQADRPAHGEIRSVLAQKAWDQCMPEMATCARVLTPTHRSKGE